MRDPKPMKAPLYIKCTERQWLYYRLVHCENKVGQSKLFSKEYWRATKEYKKARKEYDDDA